MKAIATLCFSFAAFASLAQSTITNGGFEAWGNTTPGLASEPTSFYSNQSGSSIAMLGPQTCFKDSLVVHSGVYAVRVETVSGPFSTVVNGNMTTGVIDAPTITKTDGYIGTVNYTTSTDIRHMSFTARPDSIVGWYKYTTGGSGEQGKVRVILHTAEYYDPETPTTYHPNPTANKVADALFLTPTSNVTTWTRFSVPFTYAASGAPAYVMINVTSSANQGTTIIGSKLWLDDLSMVYSTTAISTPAISAENARVYAWGSTIYVDFADGNSGKSTLIVRDIAGRAVLTAEVSNDRLSSFSLANVAPGMYVYQLCNSDYNKTGRVIIQ